MASEKKPMYVQLRSGRWYWEPPLKLRQRHGLKTTALGGNVREAWAYARILNQDAEKMGAGLGAPGTVHWVFQQFFLSENFAKLAEPTKRDYRWVLRMLDGTKLGPMALSAFPIRTIKPRHADRVYGLLRAGGKIAAAHYACRVSRRVWKWAGRQGFVDRTENPWTEMELRGLKARDQVWTTEQVDAVIAMSVEMKRPSIGLAVLIAYWFGHRQGDILSLRWDELDAKIKETSKTGRKVPVVAEAYPELAKALEDERVRQKSADILLDRVLICEATGLPWNRWTFGHNFRQVADKAGIPKTLQFRDLRATAQTELANTGSSILEMRTHSGHATVAMAARYARPTVEQFKQGAAKRIAGRKEK